METDSIKIKKEQARINGNRTDSQIESIFYDSDDSVKDPDYLPPQDKTNLPGVKDNQKESFVYDSDNTFYEPTENKENDFSMSQASKHRSSEASINDLHASENLQNSSNNSPKKSRWRKANPDKWKRNVERQKRNACLPYISKRGNRSLQLAKSPKPVDCTKCIFQCTSKFSEDNRINICKLYLNLKDYNLKKYFILKYVDSTKPIPRRPRNNESKQRKESKKYFFDLNEERTRVCQKFFMKTLCISNYPIINALKGRDEQGYDIASDKRGKATPPNKTPEYVMAHIRAHIESFPCVESHYTRKQSKRKYLDKNLSILKVYSLYKQECEENNEPSVSQITYRKIFCEEYNLSFFKPKKDRCVTCSVYEQAKEAEKKLLLESYNKHIQRKSDAEESKKSDKVKAEEDKSFCLVTFDLQSVLQIPSSDVSLMYYLRKLNMYNLTIYEANSPNNAYCYAWTEVNGKRGSCEIGICLYKYITGEIPESVKYLCLYSDTCGGQNRNQFISALFLNLVQTTHLETIEHKFLESGHTYMEVDSMHSAIEKQKKYMDVYCVQDWLNIFKLAKSGRNKKKDSPYQAHQIVFSEMLDLKELAQNIINNKGEKVNWLHIKCLKYVKSSPGVIFYRYDYKSDYEVLSVTHNRRSTQTYQVEVRKLYKSPLSITVEKKKDLLTLCQKNIIPLEYHPWYQSLTTESKPNLVPEPSQEDSDEENDII